MKKVQTITAFILLAVNIWMRFYAPIIRMALILKHISLFLLIGIGAYAGTTRIFKRFMKKYKPTGTKENLLYTGRVVSFGLIIILFGLFQFSFVEFSETPYTEKCRYYDNYNNLVYETMIYESCPELSIVELNEYVFEFNVMEHSTIFEISEIAPEQDDLSRWDDYNIEFNTTIRIEYDNDHRITDINQQMTYISQIVYKEGNQKTYIYNYQKLVLNDYANVYESIVKEAELISDYPGLIEMYPEHHLFNETDYEITRYYIADLEHREIQPEEHPISTWTYDLYKEIYSETDTPESLYLGHIVVIKENGRYRNTFLDDEHDGIDYTYRIDLYHNENNIERHLEKYDTESHNEIDKTITYSNDYPYIIINEIYSWSTDSIEQAYIEEVFYNQHDDRDITYVYSENEDIGIFDYNPYIYGIQETDYGYRVLHQRYRTQNYFSYLINGQFSSDKVYLEDARYYYGLRYQILFDIEYTIDHLALTEDTIYVQPGFIVNVE